MAANNRSVSEASSGKLILRDYVLEHIDIEVNHRCNLACRHCSAEAGHNTCPDGLNVSEIKDVLSSANDLGLRKVGLTGGEPLCDIKKLEEVASFCRNELNVTLHTHTNGMLLNDSQCNGSGILRHFESISISFLAGTREMHDYMTGTEGSFADALEGAKLLVANHLPLTCYYVPMHGTCKGFRELTQRLYDIGVRRIRPMALAPSGRARPVYVEMAPSEDELSEFEEALSELRDRLGIVIEAGHCTRLSMPRSSVLSGHEACMSGINRLHINYRGDVFPCTAASGVRELRLGNLRENGFKLAEIWRDSDLLRRIRLVHKGLSETCSSCPQQPKCQDGCMVKACGTMSDGLRITCPLTNPEVQVERRETSHTP